MARFRNLFNSLLWQKILELAKIQKAEKLEVPVEYAFYYVRAAEVSIEKKNKK